MFKTGLRYLKQIKARNTEIKFDAENVKLCRINKPLNFLMFEFMEHANEHQHLKTLAPNQKEELIFRAKDLEKDGKTQRQISEELGLGLGTVNKYLKY